MDEGSGTVTEDVTGRSADGLLEGATWVTDDPERGTVLDLGAGSDDAHVHVPHFVTDLALTDHSICAWLKPAGSQAGGFLFKGSTTDGWVAGEKQVYFGDGGLGASPGLRPTFVGWGNGWYVASSDVAADTWSHACWIWDHVGGAAGTPRVYLNGTDVGLAIDIHDANVVDRPGDTVRIGHDGSDGVDGDFAGLVDDVAIFDIALSPSQVEAVLRGDYTEFGEEPAPPPTAAPENLRGHWPFDEGSGTVTEDVTGRSADGLLEGATWVTDDPERGTVLDLGAGSDDAHVHVPHFVAGLSRGDYSICAWLKPAGSQAGGFLFKGSTTDPWVAGEKQVYFGDGSLSAASGLRPTFVGWGNGWYVGGSDVAAGTWSHACWVWDHHGGAAGTPRIYINGTDVGLAIDIHGASYEDRPGDTVRIGHDGSDGVDADFAGLVDDVAIFDIALSPSQVQAALRGDYSEFGEEPATPPTAVPENMRGHWPFDEGSGTVTEDVTGRSADGLLEGAAWVTDDSERGTVLDLGAGADDAHVHVPHFVAGLSRGDYSICAWLKPAGSQAGGFLFKGSTTDPWVAGEKQVYFGDGSLSAVSGLRPTFVGWGNGWYIGGSDVAADTWSHACWVWDHHGGAAGTPRIYINGTDVGLAIDIHGASYEDRPGDTVRIGHDGSDGVDADFAGLVDDVAIFDIVLSQGQVQAVMNGDYTEFGEPLQVPLPPWVSLMVFAVIAGSAVSIRGRIGS